MESVTTHSGQIISFKEDQRQLMRSLVDVVGIVIKKGTEVHLSCVKINVEKGCISFTTTDAEISITKKIQSCGVNKCGVIATDAIKLCEIIKKMPSDAQVDIKSDGQSLFISCKDIEFLLPYLDGDEFPCITEDQSAQSLEISGKEIKLLLEKVKFASSTEVTRQSLNGVYIELKSGTITSAATDINRLAVASIKNNSQIDLGFIISKKAVNEILKIANISENLKLFLYGTQYITRIKLCGDQISLTSKLVAGTFPAFKSAIPDNFKFKISVDKKAIVSAIERVALVSSEQSKAVKLKIFGEKMQLYATNTNASSAQELVNIKGNLEDEIEIYFSYIYLLEAFSVIDSEEIIMLFNSEDSQVVFKDDKNPDFIYVVMPMMP